jgi:microcin C transport system substrate-binding protein
MHRRFVLVACAAALLWTACGGDEQQASAPAPQAEPPPAAAPAPAAPPIDRTLDKLNYVAPLWKMTPGIPAHGISMYGELKYGPGFDHFDYVNPDAPKGGRIRLGAAPGTFDSFNPYIIKGNPAALEGVVETLLTPSADEPFSEYGLLAQSVQTPEDRSWVAFELHPDARWHDGKPVTADDVVWTFETLIAKGAPQFRFYYQSVERAEKTGERGVKFTFKPGTNRELPLIMGQLPVLPKHWWATRDFEATTLEPPLGSGPYKVGAFEAGRFVELQRVPDYWGAKLPVNRGRDNFDTKRVEYYRDVTVALEAFKGGAYDFRLESSSKDWATGYEIPEVKDGRIVKEAVPHQRPAGMQGFVMNVRRPLFQDRRVREALGLAFDFEWSNKTLFYGQYTRTDSYFENSELASSGLPAGEELAILEKLRGRIPDEVFARPFSVPTTDGSGSNRENLRRGAELLEQAGWTLVDGKLSKDGQAFAFEILLSNPQFERIVLPYSKTLERLGIDARVRTLADTSQYRVRSDTFDYDMIVGTFGQSDSPGNEQRDFWGSEAAKREGSRNAIGVADPVIDELVDLVIAAPDRASLVARTQALDRVLLWNHFVVPNFHIASDRIAYWNRFGRPPVVPRQGVVMQLDAFWFDPAKAAALEKKP